MCGFKGIGLIVLFPLSQRGRKKPGPKGQLTLPPPLEDELGGFAVSKTQIPLNPPL